MKNEKLILSGVNHKDEKAWAYLYEYYYVALCVYVRRILNSTEHAEDLVQNIFISLWNSSNKFSNIEELTNYLYKSCYNNTLIHIRNSKNQKNILDNLGKELEDIDIENYAESIREETIRQLYIHIEELPAEQRKVILLRIEGHSWDEIAGILGVSINTIKTHRSRGFNFLRKKLKNPPYLYLFIMLFA
ncbi:MAG: sigma-70 family RNA polymerase sigma factor [Dysgonomonas sp.]|nr:sigma-70 family RNA polymerase sigma factor [Dysgonomonas sp.]